MTIAITQAGSDEQIAATFDVMLQLRPHLERDEYVELIRSLMHSDGVRLLALLDDGVVRAVASCRVMQTLYCSRLLCVDDLVTDENMRSRGYGTRMMSALKDEARALDCSEIQLLSRVTREQAHRFYFREGFSIACFHLRMRLP